MTKQFHVALQNSGSGSCLCQRSIARSPRLFAYVRAYAKQQHNPYSSGLQACRVMESSPPSPQEGRPAGRSGVAPIRWQAALGITQDTSCRTRLPRVAVDVLGGVGVLAVHDERNGCRTYCVDFLVSILDSYVRGTRSRIRR